MLCEDGCLLIFRDGVISSSQFINQFKSRDFSPLDDRSPSVSPSTSPTPARSAVAGSTPDKITSENNADEKVVQGTFLTIHTGNTEDSSATDTHTMAATASQYGGPVIGHDTAPPSHHWDEGTKFLISPLRNTNVPETITIGSWRVLISILTTQNNEEHSSIDETSHGTSSSEKSNDINPKNFFAKGIDGTGSERILQSVRTLLDGHFVYHLNVPEHCTYLSVPSSHMESGSSSCRSTIKETKKVPIIYFLLHCSYVNI